ncbi:MAG: TSUP family transporter [Candidatus Thermoplasmatota archaeon]
MEPLTLVFLLAAGFVASFIDSQVGGGGVITLPAYLLVGLPPQVALGTNKVGGTASALVASINYLRSGAVPVRQALLLLPLSILGGAIGVWAVLHSSADWLVPAIMAIMVAMAAYVLLRPRFGTEERIQAGWMPMAAMALAALDIGTYDGILGPGTGSLLLFAIVGFLGYNFRRAAALGRVLNLGSNVSALTYFVVAGKVDWSLAVPMAISMGIGGWVGSHTTLKHGDRFLKPLFVAITLALLARLAFA